MQRSEAFGPGIPATAGPIVGGRLPIDAGDLLGRGDPLARAVAAIAADEWLAVTGEAGIGKTALIRVALANSGRRSLVGGAFASLAWLPYLPLRRALGAQLEGDAMTAAQAIERAVGPDVLVIDDLQWADTATMAALELLVGRIQLIAGIRTGDAGAPAAAALFERAAGARIDLAGLDDVNARAFLRRTHPGMGREQVAATVRRASGNPLLLEEMGRAGESVNVFGRALAARREALSPEARRALDLLAVADRPLPAVSVPAAGELIAAGLARPRDDDIEIRHALLADGIRAALSAAELATLHAEVAWLCRDPGERARHLAAGGLPDEAVTVLRDALSEAVDLGVRAAWLSLLADLTGDTADASAALDALDEMMDLEAVEERTRQLVADSTPLNVRMRWHRASALGRLGRPDEAWSITTAALEDATDPTSELRARLVILHGVLQINHFGNPAAALDLIEAELAAHPDHGLLTLGVDHYREMFGMYLGRAPDVDRSRAVVEQALREGKPESALRAVNLHKVILVVQGPTAALESGLPMVARLSALGLEVGALELQSEMCGAAVTGARYREAIALAEAILDRPATLRARRLALLRNAEATAALGYQEAARTLIAEAERLPADRSEASEVLMARQALAWLDADLARVASLGDDLAAAGSSSDVNLALPLKLAAWADRALGRPIRAVPRSDLPVLRGHDTELEAIAAWAAGDLAAAAVAFDRAADLHASMLPADAAQCRWAAGETRRLLGASDAVDALRVAEVAASAIELDPVVKWTHRSLRLAGVRIAAARSRRVRPIDLSARESEIVELIEHGLSNVEIARRLGLGRPTVARMVGSAMAKLGVSTRNQLAARELV